MEMVLEQGVKAAPELTGLLKEIPEKDPVALHRQSQAKGTAMNLLADLQVASSQDALKEILETSDNVSMIFNSLPEPLGGLAEKRVTRALANHDTPEMKAPFMDLAVMEGADIQVGDCEKTL